MKTILLMTASVMMTGAVIGNAYVQKKQFYPSVVYITKSNPSMAILYLQSLIFVILMGKLMRKIFFGHLRPAEMEHLIERSWYAVTETCLAFTVFRDDFSPRFVGLFTLLLFLKCFHWLAEDRVDYMERSPVISWLFHIRAVSLLSLLACLDAYFINHAYHSTLIKGASVQLVFGFEYAILLTVIVTIFVKYILHTIDLQSENPWEGKAVYMLYTDLVLGFVRVLLYLLFLAIMMKVHTFPLFAIRPMYLTIRGFKKSLNDVIMSRRAINNMNNLYPDATEEDLSTTDNVCIICREDMTPVGCKKLPCNHIFHTSCLRSWFQRQQTCPTCRMDVLQAAPRTPAPPQPVPAQQQQPMAFPWGVQPDAQAAQMPGMPPGFPPAWPQQPAQPPQAEAVPPTAGTGPFPSTQANPLPQMPNMPPFFLPPFGMPPFSVPPPMPAADLSGMTDAELQAMEGQERQHVEARIKCLRNIQTLLDAAVLQMEQYSNVIATNQSTKQTPSSTTNEGTDGLASMDEKSSKSSSEASKSRFVESDEAESGPAGAEGYTPLESKTNIDDLISDDPLNEVRRRRLERFESQNSNNTDDKKK